MEIPKICELSKGFVNELSQLSAGGNILPLLSPGNVNISENPPMITLKNKNVGDPNLRLMIYPGYSAPEVYQNRPGNASPVYFVGAMMYTLIYGTPMDAQSRLQTGAPLVQQQGPLQDVINRATDLDETRRIANLPQLWQELNRAQQQLMQPAAPAYGQQATPVAPAYGQPAAPAAPAYVQPTAPAAPTYGQPAASAAPVYVQPAPPAAPASPVMAQPAVAPAPAANTVAQTPASPLTPPAGTQADAPAAEEKPQTAPPPAQSAAASVSAPPASSAETSAPAQPVASAVSTPPVSPTEAGAPPQPSAASAFASPASPAETSAPAQPAASAYTPADNGTGTTPAAPAYQTPAAGGYTAPAAQNQPYYGQQATTPAYGQMGTQPPVAPQQGKKKKKGGMKGLIIAAVIVVVLAAAAAIYTVVQGNAVETAFAAGDYAKVVQTIDITPWIKGSNQEMYDYSRARVLISEGNNDEAIEVLEGLGSFEDSATLIKEIKYERALELMDDGELSQSLALFEEVRGYEDSTYYIDQIELYQAAESMTDPMDQFEAYIDLGDFLDSAEKAEALAAPVYEQAIAEFEAEEYSAAAATFSALSGYSDSALYLEACNIALAADESNPNSNRDAFSRLMEISESIDVSNLIEGNAFMVLYLEGYWQSPDGGGEFALSWGNSSSSRVAAFSVYELPSSFYFQKNTIQTLFGPVLVTFEYISKNEMRATFDDGTSYTYVRA